MAPLNGFPSGLLLCSMLLFLRWKPPNRSWVKKNLCSTHDGEPRRFGVPLVPAYQGTKFGESAFPGTKTKISRSEVEFFIELRIVGNVHLPILPQQAPVGIDHCRGVV